jgi:hypothetical protein
MHILRKLAFGNLCPAIASNSEAEFFQTISHTRGGESIGFLIDLHDNDTKNVAYRAKLPCAGISVSDKTRIKGSLAG